MASVFIGQPQRQGFVLAWTFVRCTIRLDIPASAEEVAFLTSHPSLLSNQ